MKEKYICPCCGFRTLNEPPPGTYQICPICFWEDDNVQYNHPDWIVGANHVSLNQARENYAAFGVSEFKFQKNVRKPTPEEVTEKISRR